MKETYTGEIIYSRGMGSYDTVMWHLMHCDDIIWGVLRKMGYADATNCA